MTDTAGLLPGPAADLVEVARLRSSAATSLAAALATGPASEAALSSRWARGMRAGGADGFWYRPPPTGTSVLSGAGPAGDPDRGWPRLAVTSFRPSSTWPSVRPLSAGPVTVYSSPHGPTGLVGDFGCTLYRGDDRSVRDHLRRVLDLVAVTVDEVAPGDAFCDVYHRCQQRWTAAGCTNDISSTTDPAGTNVGHTVPGFGHGGPPPGGTPVAAAVSAGRTFLSASDTTEVTDDCAFTVEPRLGAPGLPVVWFHTMVVFVGGRRHVLAGFDLAYRAWGADWLEDPWATDPWSGTLA